MTAKDCVADRGRTLRDEQETGSLLCGGCTEYRAGTGCGTEMVVDQVIEVVQTAQSIKRDSTLESLEKCRDQVSVWVGWASG